jgi:hypothetical protein
LIILIRNNIHAYRTLGRPILVLNANSKVFDEVFKPLLNVKTTKNIVKHGFKLDENSPI